MVFRTLSLSLSLSVECVYVHADTPVGYLTGLDLSPLTYVWSFCKHVSTGKHSTCMHDTHANTHACCLCVQLIHECVRRSSLTSIYYHTFVLKIKDSRGHRIFSICEQKPLLPTDHQVDGDPAPWSFRHFKDYQGL